MFLTLALGISRAAPNPVPANVVIIVTDDGGWADFGFNGCKDYPTPNMDRIAKAGVTFKAGYVSGPVCSVSRAGLLTSRYQSRFGHEYNITNSKTQGLPLTETLLPARFKKLGYATAAIGKWHLGGGKGFQPFERGFDYSYGFVSGSRNYYPDASLKDGDDTWRRNGEPVVEAEYTTDAIGRESVKFINEQGGKKPFFLYSAFTCPHSPMQAKSGYEEKFAGIQDKQRRTLAAMMLSQDEAVGRILDALKEKGIENDTLVWLINDNGAGVYWRFDNGIWRGKKGSLFEGGIRVAFAARWPGHIPAGAEYQKPVISLDIGATSLVAAGAAIPSELDGVDVVPFVEPGNQAQPHETLYWRYHPAAVIHDGDWKLLSLDGKPSFLFNLAADPREQKNLLELEPIRREALNQKLEAWKKDQPLPAWRGEEKMLQGIRDTHLLKTVNAPEPEK